MSNDSAEIPLESPEDNNEEKQLMLALFYAGPQDGREMKIQTKVPNVVFPIVDHELVRQMAAAGKVPTAETTIIGRAIYRLGADMGEVLRYDYVTSEFFEQTASASA